MHKKNDVVLSCHRPLFYLVFYFFGLVLLNISWARNAVNPFAGTWENDAGKVIISHCEKNDCKITIDTAYGAYVCNIEAPLKVLSDDKAVFYLTSLSNATKSVPINVSKSTTAIEIDTPEASYRIAKNYCMPKCYFDGSYNKANLIKNYTTSFDCDLAKTFVEFEVCQTPALADADFFLGTLYKQIKSKKITNEIGPQKLWLRQRNQCTAAPNIEQCLLKSYIDRILSLEQALLNKVSNQKIALHNGKYNFAYLLYLAQSSEMNANNLYYDPPLQQYLSTLLPENVFKKILPAVFYEPSYELLNSSSLMIKGSIPALYGLSAILVITPNQLWLAYMNTSLPYGEENVVIWRKNDTNTTSLPTQVSVKLQELLQRVSKINITYKTFKDI